MQLLHTLNAPPKYNPKSVQALFPEESKTHAGRMKVQLCRSILQWFEPKPGVVVDPMVGTGTTLVAADQEGCKAFVGCDHDARWIECCNRVGAVIPRHFVYGNAQEVDVYGVLQKVGAVQIDLILTSPPFPNAHTQGRSKMQKGFLAQKQTYAGNEFEHQRLWASYGTFVRTLKTVLRFWADHLALKGHVAIHIKNFVRKKQEVRADLWVAEALDGLGLNVLGYLSAPLDYRSLFQENLRYPLRKILSSVRGESGQIDELECGHRKIREEAPEVTPKSARCVECGVIPGHIEIREERVVVAQRNA